MSWNQASTRREFVRGAALAGGLVLGGLAGGTRAADPPATGKKADAPGQAEEDVSPPEDLMREHGVLNRILLVYEEFLRRLAAKPHDLDPAIVTASAGLIRSFVEDYHEKLEENHLFPRFEKAGKLVELVAVLRQQHAAGRRLTDATLHLATPAAMKTPGDREKLAVTLRQFLRMYRPHEAREDTVLFPAIRQVFTAKEFDVLGDKFEDQEKALFGPDGFEGIVAKVAGLEKSLGIYDLAQFTPKSIGS
jgi:hemerythrin-like domain-containing protein